MDVGQCREVEAATEEALARAIYWADGVVFGDDVDYDSANNDEKNAWIRVAQLILASEDVCGWLHSYLMAHQDRTR